MHFVAWDIIIVLLILKNITSSQFWLAVVAVDGRQWNWNGFGWLGL